MFLCLLPRESPLGRDDRSCSFLRPGASTPTSTPPTHGAVVLSTHPARQALAAPFASAPFPPDPAAVVMATSRGRRAGVPPAAAAPYWPLSSTMLQWKRKKGGEDGRWVLSS